MFGLISHVNFTVWLKKDEIKPRIHLPVNINYSFACAFARSSFLYLSGNFSLFSNGLVSPAFWLSSFIPVRRCSTFASHILSCKFYGFFIIKGLMIYNNMQCLQTIHFYNNVTPHIFVFYKFHSFYIVFCITHWVT